jgi:flavin-dependent dehydrogenase
LCTTRGNIHAKFVVGADGATGVVAKKAHLKDDRHLIPAVEYEIFLRDGEYQRFANSARFDFGIVTSGYAWMFPKKDHISVGMLTREPRKANLNHLVKAYLEVIKIKNVENVERHGYMIPVSSRKDGFVKHRILLVGDAAGFVDPITGEGISWAIQSGQIAARSVAEALSSPKKAGNMYARTLEEHILPDLRWARVLSKLLYNSAARTRLFKVFGQRLVEMMTDVVMGEKTYRDVVMNLGNYSQLVKRSVPFVHLWTRDEKTASG